MVMLFPVERGGTISGEYDIYVANGKLSWTPTVCMFLSLSRIASFERCLRGYVHWIVVLLLLCRCFSISGFSAKYLCSNDLCFEGPLVLPYPFPSSANERGDRISGKYAVSKFRAFLWILFTLKNFEPWFAEWSLKEIRQSGRGWQG